MVWLGFCLGLTTPLGALFAPHATTVLVIAVGIGSCVLCCTPLTITIIPWDSVRSSALARAIGLTSDSSAIVGGVVMPALAGHLADTHGLQAPLWIAFGALSVGILIALGLQKVPPGDATLTDTRCRQ